MNLAKEIDKASGVLSDLQEVVQLVDDLVSEFDDNEDGPPESLDEARGGFEDAMNAFELALVMLEKYEETGR